MTSGTRRSCRYKQLSNDCTITSHVVLALHFCQTFENRHEILWFFAPNFVQRVVLAVVRAIFGAWLQNFGSIQVYPIVKCMCDSILRICNIKPWSNFCKHIEIRPIVGTINMQIDCKWCFGWCLGTEICGREGIYAYNIIIQHNLSDCVQKITTPLYLPM